MGGSAYVPTRPFRYCCVGALLPTHTESAIYPGAGASTFGRTPWPLPFLMEDVPMRRWILLVPLVVAALSACSNGPTAPTDRVRPSLAADKGPCGPRDAYPAGVLKHCHP